MITAADEGAIRQVPQSAWKRGTGLDGKGGDDKGIAEITGLMSCAGNWPDGLRWIARRVKSSRRHLRNLTDYEKKTGWKYSASARTRTRDALPRLRCSPPASVWIRSGRLRELSQGRQQRPNVVSALVASASFHHTAIAVAVCSGTVPYCIYS